MRRDQNTQTNRSLKTVSYASIVITVIGVSVCPSASAGMIYNASCGDRQPTLRFSAVAELVVYST